MSIMPILNYKQLTIRHLKILKSLQYKSGLFAASKPTESTGYDKSWLRDNFYETMAFEIMGAYKVVEVTYRAILNIFLKHEDKIDAAIKNKPTQSFEYIHARFHPETFNEFWEEWGNKQNDAVGCILFKIGELYTTKNIKIIKTEADIRIVNKLVKYLESIEYFNDKDSGMWEEDEEIHASSVGACVAGLKAISNVPLINVPTSLITKGEETLNKLLPRESEKKFVDLALLSLIWPYNIVTIDQKNKILANVEYHLLRKRGVIRYRGDHYYNKNHDNKSEEAEWTFGLAWLAIIYQRQGDTQKAQTLLNNLIAIDTEQGMPELYFSNSPEYNPNTPLGWSESLFLVALWEMNHKL